MTRDFTRRTKRRFMIKQENPAIEKAATALEGRGAADAGICALGMPRPCEHVGRTHMEARNEVCAEVCVWAVNAAH